MQPSKITNVYVKTSDSTLLVVESTGYLDSSTIRKLNPHEYVITLDAKLIMMPDTVKVYDGLLNEFTVKDKNEKTEIFINLEYPSSYKIDVREGIPYKLILTFDRASIKKILQEKVVVIDPGHGGRDRGHRGYINLLEKNVASHIAVYLKERLKLFGARAILTRERDISLSVKERLQVADLLEADFFIGIHTNWSREKNIKGAKGLYRNEEGQKLCEIIIEELNKKLNIENLGVEKHPQEDIPKSHYIYQIPYADINVCTISNPVEEGWLRSPVFKERVACAIVNGIVKYIYSNEMA